MKSRIIWAAVLLAAFGAFYFFTVGTAMTPVAKRAPPPIARRPTPFIPPATRIEMEKVTFPPINIPMPPMPKIRIDPPALKMEVPIQNGATIDFSIGAPVVKSQGEDQDALDRALREMAEATKDATFPPKK